MAVTTAPLATNSKTISINPFGLVSGVFNQIGNTLNGFSSALTSVFRFGANKVDPTQKNSMIQGALNVVYEVDGAMKTIAGTIGKCTLDLVIDSAKAGPGLAKIADSVNSNIIYKWLNAGCSFTDFESCVETVSPRRRFI